MVKFGSGSSSKSKGSSEKGKSHRPFRRKSPSKTTASKTAASATASPLMAGTEPSAPPSSSSSRLEKDAKRAADRAARAERERQKEEKAASATREAKRSRKEVRSRRAEQEAKDARWGCWKKCQTWLVTAVHVVDVLIGLTCLVYGMLLATQFDEPAMAAVIATLTYGGILVVAALMGAFGFYSARCKRFGLAISAYTAPLIGMFYLVLLVLEFDKSTSDAIFAYLTDNADVMYLDDAVIDVTIMPFFYTVLASLTAIEVIRFLLLRNVHKELLRYDAANRRLSDDKSSRSKISKSKSSRSKSSSGRSSKKKSSHSHRSAATEPLLDEEQGGDY